jgi:hypothetical protein
MHRDILLPKDILLDLHKVRHEQSKSQLINKKLPTNNIMKLNLKTSLIERASALAKFIVA